MMLFAVSTVNKTLGGNTSGENFGGAERADGSMFVDTDTSTTDAIPNSRTPSTFPLRMISMSVARRS
jgi:hypothetical protein